MVSSSATPAERRASGGMPSTQGVNFYTCDPLLATSMQLRLSEADFAQVEPHLTALGDLAGGELDRLAQLANHHPPQLIAFDQRGERIDRIDFHPAYTQMERIAFERFGLASMSHRAGVLGFDRPAPHVVKYGLCYLFTHAEFGLMCPISVTDSTSRMIRLFGSEEQRARYLPQLTHPQFDHFRKGSQWVTEKTGGSDVGAAEARAVQEQGRWRLYGDKWFCSVVDADFPLTLARPEGAPPGTKGLAMFLVPRRLEDGRLNHYRLNRLKDKLGTRSMASGEVTYEGAYAEPVGPLDQGFKQMMEMINVSRLSNAMRAAALMRRSYLEALHHARGRVAFGRPLADQPLLREDLLNLLTETEAAAASVFFAAAVLDRADAGSETDKRLIRLLTPLLKFSLCKQARTVSSEAMEIRGGNGYIEDWVNARLVRDAMLGSIWEGPTNIVMLDVGRALTHDGAGAIFFASLHERMRSLTDATVARLGALIRGQAEQVASHCAGLATAAGPVRDLLTARIAQRLAALQAVATLVEEADFLVARGGGHRKTVLAARYLLTHVLPERDFFAPRSTDDALFSALADWSSVSGATAEQWVADCEAAAQ